MVSVLDQLDLSAASDPIDQSLLSQKLECVTGIKGQHQIGSDHSFRRQSANVHDVSSSCSRVRYGVPQGSSLGQLCLLFSWYLLP